MYVIFARTIIDLIIINDIYLNETISDNMLIFELDPRVAYQPHDGCIVHQNIAGVGRTCYCLSLVIKKTDYSSKYILTAILVYIQSKPRNRL